MITNVLNYLALGILYILRYLPLSLNQSIGDLLGSLAFYLPIERKKVVDINLKLCFQTLSEKERKDLALKNWQLFGRSMTERAYLWLGTKEQIDQLVQVKSDINLKDGKPRIFFSMHLHGIEAGLIGVSLHAKKLGLKDPMTLYIKMKNFGSKMVLRQQNARTLIRAIKNLQTVVISPDMDLGTQDSVFVSFFGVKTCTVTSISGFAKLANAEVCPMITSLNPDGKSYTCRIHPALENFPSDDEYADTQRLSLFFEDQIKARPQEYYWVHKRFKNRPLGEARFY